MITNILKEKIKDDVSITPDFLVEIIFSATFSRLNLS